MSRQRTPQPVLRILLSDNDDHLPEPQEEVDGSLSSPSRSFFRRLAQAGESRLVNSIQLCLLVLLVYGSTFYVYSYNFQGASLRIEHLATIALIFMTPFLIARASNMELRELWPFLLFGAYILVSILSIVLHSHSYRYSFFEVGLQVLTVMAAIFVFLIIDNEKKAISFMTVILAFGILEAATGIFGVLYSTVTASETMAQRTQYLFMAPNGTQNEANVFGSYMTPIAIIAWVMFRTSSTRGNTVIFGAISTLTLFCVLYSFTRAAWIAVVIGLVLAEIALRHKLNLRCGRLQKLIAVTNFFVMFILLAGFLSVPLKIPNDSWSKQDTKKNLTDFFSKGARVIDTSDSSIDSRIQVTKTAFEKLKDFPFLGPGARAYKDIQDDDAQNGTPAFNYSLLSLYNSGIIGFPFYATFILVAIKRSFQSASLRPGPVSIACGAGFLALMIIYNTSSALLSSYPWLFFGIILRMYFVGRQNQISD